jgi:hypothetical protein
MPRIVCNYGLHFSEIAQMFQERVELPGRYLKDLVHWLEKNHQGFQKELISPSTGELMTRNAILIQRGEENTGVVSSLESELRDGDILTFF